MPLPAGQGITGVLVRALATLHVTEPYVNATRRVYPTNVVIATMSLYLSRMVRHSSPLMPRPAGDGIDAFRKSTLQVAGSSAAYL
ncbi:MAG: hypothetical protein U9N09_00105, partial [Euryarchaeota archaeon]|nr:hypothetical protein [Euryarchaeota archaeon]